jgi:hypothetical protein
MRDLKNNVDAIQSIDPATHNSNQTGTGVDLQGYEAAMAVVYSGALTDGTHTPKLQESDDDSSYTDVSASDVVGTFANISADAVQRVGYKGSKRYVRVFVTSSGATGAIYGAMMILGVPHHAPVA